MIKEWIAALRSKKWKQCSGRLKKHILGQRSGVWIDSHCCLGVLCEISGIKAEKDTITGEFLFDGARIWLPESLERKLNISLTMQATLAEMNDMGFTFEGIADYIEKELPSAK